MRFFQDPVADVLLQNLIDVTSVTDVTGILVTFYMNGVVAYVLRLGVAGDISVIFPVLFTIHEAVSYKIM